MVDIINKLEGLEDIKSKCTELLIDGENKKRKLVIQEIEKTTFPKELIDELKTLFEMADDISVIVQKYYGKKMSDAKMYSTLNDSVSLLISIMVGIPDLCVRKEVNKLIDTQKLIEAQFGGRIKAEVFPIADMAGELMNTFLSKVKEAPPTSESINGKGEEIVNAILGEENLAKTKLQ